MYFNKTIIAVWEMVSLVLITFQAFVGNGYECNMYADTDYWPDVIKRYTTPLIEMVLEFSGRSTGLLVVYLLI